MYARARTESSIRCNCGRRNKTRTFRRRVSNARCRSCRVALSFDRQFDIDRALFLAQRAAELRERDVLQLSNALPCHAEFLSHFLERFRFSAVQPEALENNFLLAIVQ